LHNVRHIPALKRNLISIGQLDDEGHHTTFGDGAWKVTKGNLVVARGKKRWISALGIPCIESLPGGESRQRVLQKKWQCKYRK